MPAIVGAARDTLPVRPTPLACSAAAGGPRERRRGERDPERLRLLGRQRRVGASGDDGLRVQPRPGSRVEAADRRSRRRAHRSSPARSSGCRRSPRTGCTGRGRPAGPPVARSHSRIADRADSSSTSRTTLKTLSRWASRTASRLRPSAPRVIPSSRRPRRRDPTRLDDDQDERGRRPRSRARRRQRRRTVRGGVQVDRTVLRNGGEESLGGRPSLAFGTSPQIAGRPAATDRCYPPRDPRAATANTRRQPRHPMAKRSRLGARPGQRRPLQRSAAGARTTTRPANAVTAEEMARAAELEAADPRRGADRRGVPQEPRPPDEGAGRRHGDLLLEHARRARVRRSTATSSATCAGSRSSAAGC